ncbi:MAG TPA: glycosyltransferase, partial [Flavitalea sp.]|nr:glycosyltransferase [Flavitalea sp.]
VSTYQTNSGGYKKRIDKIANWNEYMNQETELSIAATKMTAEVAAVKNAVEKDVFFPKILLVGISFDQSSGCGITLSNLFKKWDRSRLAIANEFPAKDDYSMAEHVYQLGYDENRRRFPFNLFQKKTPSGPADKPVEKIIVPAPSSDSYHSKFPFLVKWYNRLLHFFGLYHYSRKPRISEKFGQWVTDFHPDFVYTHANELDIIEMVLQLKKKYKLKVTTHVMDHYIDNYFNPPGLLHWYWQRRTAYTFRDLINQSDLCFSIGEEMNKAYSKKYGKNFTVFHNGLDIALWKMYRKKDYVAADPFTILYAGRITIGTDLCLLEVAQAIDQLPEKRRIRFHIQTTSRDPVLQKLSKYPFVHIGKIVPYQSIPGILASADVLLLAHNFDLFTRKYFRFSFPTKAPEYMVTGVPVLLYGPGEIAVTKHARKHQWAFIIDSPDSKKLTHSIRLLYNNGAVRKSYGTASSEFAMKNFNLETMQENLRLTFENALIK